ncbi:DUF4292 domain-containing protein [bacterium]|nr:MAG: DUF4292 domain-containing protein [bacterium]
MFNKNTVLLGFLISVSVSCGVFKKSTKETTVEESFTESSKSLNDVFTLNEPAYLSGKAKVLFSSQQASERFTVEFEANKTYCLMSFKNPIGIEAVQLFVDADSVVEYNKIDKTLIKMSKQEYGDSFSSGFVPYHLYDLFFPERLFSSETKVMENTGFYQLTDSFEGLSGSVIRKNLGFTEIQGDGTDISFTKVKFSDHANLKSGRGIARRLVVFGREASTRLSIALVDFRESAEEKVVYFELPKSVHLERL